MANEDELAEAKQWCDEARQLLKTKKIAKNGDSEIREPRQQDPQRTQHPR